MKKALPLPARSPPPESVPPWEIGGWREKAAPSQEGASGRGNSMGNGWGGGGQEAAGVLGRKGSWWCWCPEGGRQGREMRPGLEPAEQGGCKEGNSAQFDDGQTPLPPG